MTPQLSPLSYLNLPFHLEFLSSPVDKRIYKELSTQDISSEFALCTNKWPITVFEDCLRYIRHHLLTRPAQQRYDAYGTFADAAAIFARECIFKDEALSRSFEYSSTKHPTGLWRSYWFGFNIKNARATSGSEAMDDDIRWFAPSSYEDVRQCNWTVRKSCLCVVYFLTRDAFDLAEINIGAWTCSDASPMVHGLLSNLRAECLQARCSSGLITDGHFTIVYKHNEAKLEAEFVDILFYPAQERSVLFLFALALFTTGCTSLDTGPDCQYDPLLGALNDPSIDHDNGSKDEAEILARSRHSREDFDLYTMQRRQEEYMKFCLWHVYVQAQALRLPLQRGTTLKICPNRFGDRYLMHRSLYPCLEIPEETLSIVTHNRRPRDRLADAALSSTSFVEFELTDVVRAGPRQWSQVFFGMIPGTSRKLCLKLFDERYFHMPEPPSFKDSEPQTERLLSYNVACDMLRREESVYDRLSDFQGTFIPHCYGFHEFIQPDRWRSLGVLLELIPGPSIADLAPSTHNIDAKHSIVTQLRHCFRVLKCRGINQTDWHANQILCLHPRGETSTESLRDFVFIDFAFALQCLGHECGCRETGEWNKLSRIVRSTFQVPRDEMREWWIPRAEYEW